MRVGTVTDHVAAAKADYEGGDYWPEVAERLRVVPATVLRWRRDRGLRQRR
jgi:hypothetical protein